MVKTVQVLYETVINSEYIQELVKNFGDEYRH